LNEVNGIEFSFKILSSFLSTSVDEVNAAAAQSASEAH
jgi:hypothetical protein